MFKIIIRIYDVFTIMYDSELAIADKLVFFLNHDAKKCEKENRKECRDFLESIYKLREDYSTKCQRASLGSVNYCVKVRRAYLSSVDAAADFIEESMKQSGKW